MRKGFVETKGTKCHYEIPATHRVVHDDHLTRWRNDSKILWRIRSKIQQPNYNTDNTTAQSIWGSAMSAVPALALSAAQHLFPLICMAFFYDTGLMSYSKFNIHHFVTSFPSDWLLRKCICLQASRDIMLLGIKLKMRKLYIACDKGNKKGVGHFVKILASYNPDEGIVETHLLDIDASGGTSAECATAIQASMNKLKIEDDDNTHLLSGQCTDSGGGGTLESLYNNMAPLGICDPNEYLIANCCIHSLQTQLKNAIETTFGTGGLDKINAMQLIHSVYRLQESIDADEWRHILYKSKLFVANYNTNPAMFLEDDGGEANVRNFESFIEAHSKVGSFYNSFNKALIGDPKSTQHKGTTYAKMTQPILSRWWTVGAGASYVFDNYLQLYYACQMVINIYPSTNVSNDIASDLFALMSNQENFVDMTLIRSFNKAYVNSHLDWLQSSNDLTGNLGFQAHHIAARYYVMETNYRGLYTHAAMKEFVAVVNACPDDGEGNHARHLQK